MWPPPPLQVPPPPASDDPSAVLLWLVGILAGAVGVLFGLYIKSQGDRIADARAEAKEWQDQGKAATTATAAGAEANRKAAEALERQGSLIGDLIRSQEAIRDAIDRVERRVCDPPSRREA